MFGARTPSSLAGSHHLSLVRTVGALRAAVAAWRADGDSVGLVPTMGALHGGHLGLLRAAQRDCRRTLVTLFVNPTQFGPNEDLARYPRDEARDRRVLAEAGADLLFAPEVAEMYPPGFSTSVAVSKLTEHLDGPLRPGHFAGVATVVTKLLLQAQPDRAYFGEKDFQQLQVIRRLARDLDIPAAIVGVPTVREPDGLALSSRNAYLAPAERAAAATLPRVLRDLGAALARDPSQPVAPLTDRAAEELRAAGFAPIDYVAVCDAETLQPVARAGATARIFAAAWLGRTRLIDNMPIPPS